jgi:phenylalanyl-tRNA synthetase beta chain
MSHHQEAIQPLKRVRDLLVARGFHEAITYSFIEPELLKTFNPDADPMILPNPIASDMSAMRVSLLPGLVNTVVYNQNRQQSRIRLFETGLRFVKDATAENGIRQESMLAGIITGTASNENWAIEERTVDFFDLKGDLEAVLELTATPEHFHFVAGQHAAMHPGQTAAILCDDKTIGYIGVIHPSFEKKLGLKSKAIVFELELSAVLNRAVPAYTDISKFPANRRDLAFVVDQTISADQILRLTRKVGGNQVVGINLFDVYQGAGVADGKKSLALSVTLQHTDRTLEEKEIAETIDHIVDALRVEFNATLRD